MSVITPPEIEPGGECVERVIAGIGTVRFENYGPGQWLTKKGKPAKISRRRYLLDGSELDSVSNIVGTLDKPALLHWYEEQATIGAVAAERLGALAGLTEDQWLEAVRKLELGASAKRDEGADRGTAIHAAFHALAVDGTVPNPADFPEIARPWVQGAIRAWLALRPDMIASEEIVCHPEQRYGGRPDLLAVVGGRVTLVDYKTGKGRVFEQGHYQTRLYAMALRELGVEVDRIVIIGIDDAGNFEPYDCEATEADALALIRLYRSRKRINSGMTAQRNAQADVGFVDLGQVLAPITGDQPGPGSTVKPGQASAPPPSNITTLTSRERNAVQKVRVWHAWLEAGGDPKTRPPEPGRRDRAIAQICGPL